MFHFGFEDTPEPFHRTVIDAPADPGHTLDRVDIVEFSFKHLVRELEAPVAVEERLRSRVAADGLVECREHEPVVIMTANSE